MPLPLGSDSAALYARLDHLAAERAPRIWVGLSGGVDSSVLAVLAARRWPQKTHLVHVNHHLQSPADEWAQHCRQLAEHLAVPIVVKDVAVSAKGGPEGAARDARYEAFCACLAEGDLLLLAHHADDQIETLFYRLLRGTGVDGLSGMPEWRALGVGQLWRPWLAEPRARVIAAAQELKLTWIEDPSNDQIDADRNFLRQRVLPLLEQRWPHYRTTVERARQNLAQTAQREHQYWRRALTECLDDGALNIASLASWSEADQLSLLRAWLLDLKPSQQQLLTVWREVVGAAADAQPQVQLGATSVRRYQQKLYRVTDAALMPEAPLPLSLGSVLRHPGVGEVALIPPEPNVLGLPLSAEIASRGDLSIRFRLGGERFKPAGRSGSRDLKRLMQEWRVPPWRRDQLPLFYVGERLAAVGCTEARSGWYADEFLSAPIEPAGILCYRIVPS
ncbi:tRNA lysidine(34) synthetase TilS [Salinispirillum sp. LH 10-3-1]|uniref:tRNA(Ile)-lysidine synthase n=1 Tax=Salinispirillum sp. LH 10-3-1 TaxID=2952525 RepID=A0AB38YJI7_9GAMM